MKHFSFLLLLSLLALATVGCQVVPSGNYTLKQGETLSGGLLVTSGRIVLEDGSRVAGPVWMSSGNLVAGGQIDGDLVMSSGNVALGPNARVLGHVRRLSGNVTLAPGAQVRGGASYNAFQVPFAGAIVLGVVCLTPLIIIALILIPLLMIVRPAAPRTESALQPVAPPATPIADTVMNSTAESPASAPLAPGGPRGTARLAFGGFLVLLGILFLVDELLNVDLGPVFWPFAAIIFGLLFFALMLVGGLGSAPFAIPGSILTMVGLILSFQNLTGHYESWAYAWSLIFPIGVGIGLLIQGLWGRMPQVRDRGLQLIGSGLVLFVVLAAFFEIGLNLGGYFAIDFSRFALPILLILVGVLMVAGTFVRWLFRSLGGIGRAA